MYKFEIHLHTSGCSACATSCATEMLDAAKEHGYSGVVFTNHFYHGNTAVDRDLTWKEFVNAYAEDYYTAEKYGEALGLKVFFGIEEGYATGKEMLIYGISHEVLMANPKFNDMSAAEKVNFVHKNGGFTVCAHPFRNRFYIPDPDTPPDISLFDGIECYNHFNKPEENEKAFKFAEENHLIKTCGGDIHNSKDFGKTGIAFNTPIETYSEFIEKMKSGDFTLIIP